MPSTGAKLIYLLTLVIQVCQFSQALLFINCERVNGMHRVHCNVFLHKSSYIYNMDQLASTSAAINNFSL